MWRREHSDGISTGTPEASEYRLFAMTLCSLTRGLLSSSARDGCRCPKFYFRGLEFLKAFATSKIPFVLYQCLRLLYDV
jgi:hypothetical protein